MAEKLLVLLALFALARPALGAKIVASVTDDAGQPVEDAVVFVYGEADGPFKGREMPYEMDQVDKTFVPHVLPILVGSKVRFPNLDNIHHHLYSFSSPMTFELPLYKGEPTAPLVFSRPGVVKLACNIHDWMMGIILVLPNPYFARTGPDGQANLSVPDLPQVELAVFHERLKGPVEATRRSVKGEKGLLRAEWRLALKPLKVKKRPAIKYP